jgi:hypothetical protein
MRKPQSIASVCAITMALLHSLTVASEGHRPSVCVVPFEIAVRHGPSAGLSLEGVLALTIEHDGAIKRASFAVPDRPEIPVVGQANGRAINLFFDLGDEGMLFGVGTAQYDIRECRGPMGGPFTGPLPGDLGDWLVIHCCT